MSAPEKNKILSDNAVISTVHFQKRIEKIFADPSKNLFICSTFINVSFALNFLFRALSELFS